MRRFIREILTDYDNQTYDTARVLAVGLILSMVSFQAMEVWQTGKFDAMQFGGGCAAVLGALGLAIGGDNHNRPK